jgi:curli biogenesis system outer membrane secretion channel CsgG
MIASMKRVSALLILFLVMLSSCASQQVSYEEGGTLAVWDLDNLGPLKNSTPDLGELLSSQIIDTLQKQGDYTVVERERLLLALEELHIGTTLLVDENTRLKLGKLVGARLMVFGGYQIIGDVMRIDLRVVNVETGEVLRAVKKTTSNQSLPGWIDTAKEAAEELVKQ